MRDPHEIRPTLGDFSSIICFRSLVVGTEETLGKAAAMVTLKAAGRKRGQDLVASLGLTGAQPPIDGLAKALDDALGAEGTRLCQVDKCEKDGDVYRIFMSDTICSADEPQGSKRELSFTFGAVHGALEALYGIKVRGKQTGSVLRGQDYDIVEFVER